MANIKNRKLFNLTHDILRKIYFIMPTLGTKIFVSELLIKNGIFWGAIKDSDNWELIY